MAVYGADMTLSPSWAFCIDIGRDNAGIVSGTMNMAGNLGAFVTILAFPYLFKWTGHYEPFFIICAGLSVAAVLIWWKMDPERSIAQEIQKN
jgi:ACS family glucarate transporter-like MFS transporter